jgi:hypothetical protein
MLIRELTDVKPAGDSKPDDEPRFNVDLQIRVFDMDAESRPFSQKAQAQNISDHGAKLSGLEKQLKPRDIIGALLGEKKARCEVVWVVDAGQVQKIEVGVKMVKGQKAPWENEMGTQRAMAVAPVNRTKPAAKDKRKHPRHRIAFQIEVRDAENAGAELKTRTSDIAAGGCYIETLLPLPVKKILTITFWLNSTQIHTSAVVRTSDGGVGMGIEFTGLDEVSQKQLQRQLETLAMESEPFQKAKGAAS